jgi:hypothetical protein
MQDHTFTLIVSAVGIGGALAGIVIGHFLTRSSQHEQWLRDNCKQEFRELISALAEAAVEHLFYVDSQTTSNPQPIEKLHDAQKKALRTIVDRIYIASEVRLLSITRRRRLYRADIFQSV